MIEDVHATFDPPRPAQDRLVPECVGEPFDRVSRGDRVAVQVQLAMDLDERHGPGVPGENGQHGRAEVLADERLRVRCNRWNRRGTAATRDAEAVHDVLGIDARPQHDAHLGEPGADLGELLGERPLLRVERIGPGEQRGDLGEEDCGFVAAVRQLSIAGRKANGGHERTPGAKHHVDGGSPAPPRRNTAARHLAPHPSKTRIDESFEGDRLTSSTWAGAGSLSEYVQVHPGRVHLKYVHTPLGSQSREAMRVSALGIRERHPWASLRAAAWSGPRTDRTPIRHPRVLRADEDQAY